ncbi:hypothetical protein HAX54_053168, partial [Datura stramonium]|nr:hypothetical protein [Datura stramonium]
MGRHLSRQPILLSAGYFHNPNRRTIVQEDDPSFNHRILPEARPDVEQKGQTSRWYVVLKDGPSTWLSKLVSFSSQKRTDQLTVYRLIDDPSIWLSKSSSFPFKNSTTQTMDRLSNRELLFPSDYKRFSKSFSGTFLKSRLVLSTLDDGNLPQRLGKSYPSFL